LIRTVFISIGGSTDF